MEKQVKIELKVEGATNEQLEKYKEIFKVLVETGSLDGIRAGSAIIHFDHLCVFQGIEHAYWPWRRKKEERWH